jgi:serine phosphatase RsbU (regulator of sigma subunit)
MKIAISILIFALPTILPNSLWGNSISIYQDLADTATLDYEYYDNLAYTADSLESYSQALDAVLLGLKLAELNQDAGKEWHYHLKLAKYYYLTGQTDEALTHFRLYALVKESEKEFEKEREIRQLEDVYLEEIENILREMDMDKRLIQNLQSENESYYQGQQKIKLAIKIGAGSALIVILILGYNRIISRKKKRETQLQEVSDLQKFKEQAEKFKEELERNENALETLKSAQQHNLSYARNIQLSLLPKGIELEETVSHSFVLHIPRDIISGDFYTIKTIGVKSVLALFDCPGHGVDAAHSTVVTFNLFKSIVEQGITAPSMILTMLDQKLKHETNQVESRSELISGVKIAVCTLNRETKEMEYAGAHFPLFYIHLDELHFIRGNRFPIGDPLFSDKFYSSSNIRLSTGDMIYLSTDGYYSQLGGRKNKKFLRSSLGSLIKSIHSQSVKEQKFILEKVFQEWKSRGEQTDDVLVVGMRL